MLRAVVDSALCDEARLKLVQDVTELILSIYEGTQRAEVKTVQEKLVRHLGNLAIAQADDPATKWASTADKSESRAYELETMLQRPALIIPLCHGGFPAAAQTFLYRQRNHPDDQIYPVRFSMQKQWDNRPRVGPAQIEHLSELARERTIVVYDEDAGGGATLAAAVYYFSHVLNQPDTLGMANLDFRSEAKVAEQGVHWELCATSLYDSKYARLLDPSAS